MTQHPNILIVDDDPVWLRAISSLFTLAGYAVRQARTCAEALKLAADGRHDAILLDFHLADGDGGDICAAIRADAAINKVPIIMISADPLEEQNAYFRYKADAFVLKGTELMKIRGVVESLLRRVSWERGTIEKDDLRLEPRDFQVLRGKKLLASLSPDQFALLALLLEKSPEVVSEDDIAKRVFDSDFAPDKTDAIRGLVYRLRLSLGRQIGRRIRNKSGRGWTYVSPRP